MNAELLLQHFKRLSEAPDAIPRLRRFIIDLAVRGKLVPQDAKEGTGKELLSSLKKSRAEWEATGRIRKNKGGQTIAEDKKYFEVPDTWVWARLTEIGQTQTGTSPSSANTELFGDFIPFVKPADLDGNEINYDGPGLSEAGVGHSRLVCAYSVLMVCIGATLGKVNKTTRPICFNQQINSLTPYLDSLTDYLVLALKTSGFHNLAWSKAGTGTLPIISKGKWEILQIPLPPLAEQHRIVAKVDELMALCDQLEAAKAEREQSRDQLVAGSLQQLNQPTDDDEAFREHAHFTFNHLPRITTRPAHIKQLRQTILNLAVRGRLVTQNPNDEPAAELLKRIQAEKNQLIRDGKIREQKPLSTKSDDTSVKPPSTWQSVQLSEIVYLRSGIAIEYGDDQPAGEIPYVKVSDLNIDGNNKGIFTSSRFIGVKYANSIIEPGSIVFPKRGGAIATNRKRVTHVEVVCDSNLMAMRPFLHETSAFLQLWFSGFDLWQLNSGTSVPQINNNDIYPLFIPLPPLAEQHRIVAKFDELMALCDQLEAQLYTTEIDSRRLLEAVLHEALTPALEEAA
jgi:type I restriction enzyme S subunit